MLISGENNAGPAACGRGGSTKEMNIDILKRKSNLNLDTRSNAVVSIHDLGAALVCTSLTFVTFAAMPIGFWYTRCPVILPIHCEIAIATTTI